MANDKFYVVRGEPDACSSAQQASEKTATAPTATLRGINARHARNPSLPLIEFRALTLT